MTRKLQQNKSEIKSPPTSFRLEAVKHRSGMSLIFSGIVSINVFEDTCIELKSHGCKINIVGQRLNITVFENNSLEITGKVGGVDFSYGKN